MEALIPAHLWKLHFSPHYNLIKASPATQRDKLCSTISSGMQQKVRKYGVRRRILHKKESLGLKDVIHDDLHFPCEVREQKKWGG